MALATELVILILLSAVLAWMPIGIRFIGGGQLSLKLWVALTAFTLSSLLLFIFGFGDFMLWDSHKFAAVGIPGCVLAVALAIADTIGSKSLTALGVALSSFVNILIWLYLSMLH